MPAEIALQGHGQDDTKQFLGLGTEAVAPPQFFAPDNMQWILVQARR